MVVSARMAAGLSGLRNRNTRVTNKTQLRVVRGSIEGDPILLDDDDEEKNRVLASQGVDDEDANEHHLQAALFASSQRTSSQIKPTLASEPNAYIPTPDATGLVADYDNLYRSAKYKDPVTHLRFSDSLDESCVGGLAGAFTYFLDERDADWLERNNVAAKGEGTSASASASRATSPVLSRAPHSRSAKAKGKEPELHPPPNAMQLPNIVIDEDHFELIMGLFEKRTDETVSPYLHLAPDPEHFPNFDNYHNFFAGPLPLSTFANFQVPSYVPAPERMVQLAKAIYPWWRERRIERQGRRIVPQLHVLVIEAQEKEDKMGGSPYTCFRKRDAKPVRKTRTNNVMHTEKLARLRTDLQTTLELAEMVLQREKLKRESTTMALEVWRSRKSLAGYMKQLSATAPGSVPPVDELLLFDKERKSRKPRIETTASGRIILTGNRRPLHVRGGFADSLDPHSPLTLNGDTSHAFEQCQMWPSARMTGIQREVDREFVKARKDDTYWEDLVDMPYQHMPSSSAEKLFKPLSSFSSDSASSSVMRDEDPAHPHPHATRVARAIRLRTGRGGRMHLDRRLYGSKAHRLLQREWAGYPPRAEEDTLAQQEAERWAARSWRPRCAGARLGRRERQLGEDYWAHWSIYERDDKPHVPDSHGMQREQDPTIGFEQSGYGWEARELCARARASREEDGWKPTPFLVVDPECLGPEVAKQNAAERERIVEAWRGHTIDDPGGRGGALALFTDGGAMGENDVQPEATQGKNQSERMDFWPPDGQAADAVERAWRADERWRYDSDSDALHGQDTDDRFLLDDFQAKFLRTTTTLLDAQDHETIMTDPQLLTPAPPKQNRYLDHQLRTHHPGLPQASASAAPTTLNLPTPPRQIPIPSLPLPAPSPGANANANATAILAELQPISCSPSSQSRANQPAVNGTSVRPIPRSPPKPNGTVLPGGARLPPDSAATMRVSTPVRTKHAPLGLALPQAGFPNGTTNGNRDGEASFPPHAPPYPSLKSALGRAIAPQQDVPQQGRLYQVPAHPGMNGSESAPMNLSLGVGNLQFKMPAQRAAQVRPIGTGENHGEGTADPYAHTNMQQLRLPTTGPRMV